MAEVLKIIKLRGIVAIDGNRVNEENWIYYCQGRLYSLRTEILCLSENKFATVT
jgi:hypothetical protein